ncbi:MAG: SDR family oxidoreductase, partial [Myxococcota bacterium]
QMERAAGAVEEALGAIDLWINNAMSSVFARTWDITPEEFKRVTEVTYLGQVYGTQAALRRMRPRDRGTILLVGSALAKRGIPLQAPYCAAKHAVQGFFESLRTELLDEGSQVQLTTVHLPAMNTPQFRWVRSRLPNESQPVPPIFQPEVAADAIVWASAHPRREMYVGGSTVQTIWGNRLAPWLVDWYLGKKGVSGQQIDEPREDRPDNLQSPVEGDRGAHGVYDRKAKSRSAEAWVSKHRAAVGTGAVAGAAALGAVWGMRRR